MIPEDLRIPVVLVGDVKGAQGGNHSNHSD
jgi:hypothetical protein